MDWLEQELKSSLERKPPSPGFAGRVSDAAARPRPTLVAWPRWVPAAAAVALLLSGGYGYREYQGRLAKERVLLAMKIVSGKLNHMQTHVREVSR